MGWHIVEPYCPQCDTPYTIMSIYSSAGGKILIKGCCVTCGVFLKMETSGASFIRNSVLQDIEDEKYILYAQNKPKEIQ